ncbi:Septation initiation network scaffold protein cdc11 OS=Schizosaccharomyces pombe (strain 972 / ATCC 24843) GN=cdc11 PE=1 SV=1 [Rhizoctonia solani AG-1 IB]|uniref:Septation initiation network scaffold protein cdc11 n=1 Tax=Thanatephorus cucumeris (strain AG1-IB / isolate 7/3/14) TaxID=1108050 RepID=A0A0B7G1K6_THACB|nr:Septation initiation network scaffold protein cdc11 OS=Schizosaccharomyces pombe (strain 972 / ATCC 24843) GN=cdc11 PE=1 SV=1 [Rhizoctonia solani AG-1 IB]
MSRPAWMTDELDEEWVEPQWDDEGGNDSENGSQRSRRSVGSSKSGYGTQVYGSVRVGRSSPTPSSNASSSMKERSIRGLLQGDDGKRKKGLSVKPGTISGGSSPEVSPTVGTFLVREDIPQEPLKAAPAALKKSAAKNFFTPLALERMFEPPSPPAGSTRFEPQPPPISQPQSQQQTQASAQRRQPIVSPIHTTTGSPSTDSHPSAPNSSPSTSPTSIAPSKYPSPGNTTPSPHATPITGNTSRTPSPTSTSSQVSSFAPSPSAGRGPLGTFRLPHHHAPIRPSRLSESHLVKPYESFEAEESSQSSASVTRDILADMSNIQHEEKPFGSDPETSHSGKIPNIIEEDDERLTNDLDFGDDDLIVGDDGNRNKRDDADEADSILDLTLPDIDKKPKRDTEKVQEPLRQEIPKASTSTRTTPGPDEIIDTDIPGLSLFDGRKLSANYRFTFAVPRNEGANPVAQSKKSKRERRREREAERTDSRPSSRASSNMDELPLREGYRTPSPGMIAQRDARLKLFQFHYDTFTRDHLSALVDSIAVGSVGSSPSLQQVNTMEFRGDDPHALSTPSDAVRYAKKIKLTPPEDFSDWDGERSGEEQADGETADNDTEDGSRPTSGRNRYANAVENMMQAARDAHGFDGESVFSTTQQGTEQDDGEGEEDMDMDEDEEFKSSLSSAANDYRRRGADLMAQLREEFSDDEDGSLREGSVTTRDGSTSGGGSLIIKGLNTLQPYRPNPDSLSPSDLVINRDPPSSFGRRTQLQSSRNQDPVEQLSSSLLATELGDKAGSVKSNSRQFLKKLGIVDEAPRTAARDGGLAQPPRISVVEASPEPPRPRERPTGRVRSASDLSARIQPSSLSTSSRERPLAQSYLEPQRPVSPTRHDMNRFVSSSSTADTKTSTARSAGSYVKHPGPPIPGVRQIVPSDLPAEALPERVGRMVYDRAAMRWRQEVDGNMSESEDPFRDFDSFASTVEEQDYDAQRPQPMKQVDEHEVDMEQDSASDSNDTLSEPAKAPAGHEAAQSSITYDSDVSTELNVVDVSPTASIVNMDGDDLGLYDPSLKSAPTDPDDQDHEPEIHEQESTNIEILPARPVGPLRPALKSAASTPAASAGSSRRSTPEFTPMQNAQSRRSVSFSDGRMSGKIRGLSIRDIANDTPSELTSLTLTTPESEAAPSSRMQRIGKLLEALEDDSMLANLSIAPGKQPAGESDEDEDTTEQSDMGRGDPDVDPDVSRNPRSFARTYSFGTSDRTSGQGNATFLTECSFGVAHERLVELITDVHPYKPYWEPLSEIDLSKKGIESLARLKEFLPNLDRLNVHGNELAYLSGIPSCLRNLNVAQNQLTSMTSYSHLANLEVLDISNNQIDSVAQLRCLRHLRELSAAGNTIGSLSGIDQTTSLVKVNLKGNCLKSVSLEDCTWPHVDSIDFSNNGMKTIAGLSSVPTLVTLNLDHNVLADLHVDTPLPRLRNLRLSDNKLTELDCSSFVNLRTLYVDNNKLGTLRHVDKARRLENLSLRNQSGRGLHLSISHIRDVKRLYLSGNPLDPSFLEVPCYNLVYLELAACRLSSLPTDLCRLVPNLRVLNLNYNFLSDARPLGGLMRLRKLTMIGSRLKATKPLLRSLQSMKELEMLDFRMNPFSLGWYLPLLVRDVPGALQPSETNGKNSAPWSDLDVKFRRDLPDELYIGRLAYRGLVMRVCPQVRIMDGIEITQPERAKAQKLLLGIEQSHKASVNPSSTRD